MIFLLIWCQIWIIVDEFPKNINGKVDLIKLKEHYSKPTTLDKKVNFKDEYYEKIYHIWKKLTGHEVENLEDNFFDVGGSSLIIMEFTEIINKTFSIKINILDVFSNSSIKLLAEFIKNNYVKSNSISHAIPAVMD